MISTAVTPTSGAWPGFSPPANIQDFATDPALQAQLDWVWTQYLLGSTQTAILGNPFSSVNDQNRNFYVNPMAQAVPSSTTFAPIKWVSFPNRLSAFFNSPSTPSKYLLTPQQVYELAEFGAVAGNPLFQNGLPDVPQTLCPSIDWNGPFGPYTPQGSRGWLDEYCEMCVTRDPNRGNKITKVVFTCENPEYYFSLWRVDPGRVLELYQQYVNPGVKFTDLCLRSSGGQIVIDPDTGYPAYDPLNIWNTGTHALAGSGGAMHLTSAPNTVGAEIYLAAAATIARPSQSSINQDTLICCTRYGRPYRNSDPHIGFTVNQNVYNPPNNMLATLADPIGLYIQQPATWSNFQMPAGYTGTYTPQDCWKVLRGKINQGPSGNFDRILRVEFSLPDSMQAQYTVSDMTVINTPGSPATPIQFASQIMLQFQIGLAAQLWPTSQQQNEQPCPTSPATALPQVVQLLGTNVMAAYNAPKWFGNPPPALPPMLRQGETLGGLSLSVAGGTAGTTFIGPAGVTIHQSPMAPDGTYPVSVTVDSTAATGPVAIQAVNPGQTPGPAQPNVLVVGPAPSSTPTHLAAAAKPAPRTPVARRR